MFTPIDRYDAFNAAVLNARLTQLEDAWLRARDPNEIIIEETLAASTETIDIDISTAAWSMLHLTATLIVSGGDDCMLRCNNDTTGNYGWGYFRAGANWLGQSGAPSPNPTGVSLGPITAVTQRIIDLWVIPLNAAVVLLGEGLDGTSSMQVYHVGGSYRYAATSLQLTFEDLGVGSYYDVGSVYRLEGIRA